MLINLSLVMFHMFIICEKASLFFFFFFLNLHWVCDCDRSGWDIWTL